MNSLLSFSPNCVFAYDNRKDFVPVFFTAKNMIVH